MLARPHHIGEFVDGHAALLNQFHPWRLAVADQKLGQLSLALPSLVNRTAVSFHGGSPFQGFVTPILFRIKGEPPPQLSTTDETPSGENKERSESEIEEAPHETLGRFSKDSSGLVGTVRAMHRKPMWLIPVSIICGWRAAGR